MRGRRLDDAMFVAPDEAEADGVATGRGRGRGRGEGGEGEMETMGIGGECCAEVGRSGRDDSGSVGGVVSGGLEVAVANVEEESAFVKRGSGGGRTVEASLSDSGGGEVMAREGAFPRVSDEADSVEEVV